MNEGVSVESTMLTCEKKNNNNNNNDGGGCMGIERALASSRIFNGIFNALALVPVLQYHVLASRVEYIGTPASRSVATVSSQVKSTI